MARTTTRRKTTGRQDAAEPSDSPDPAVPESLEQVRDILFGGQMRSVESRFARLEERLQRDQEALRTQTAKHLDRLEAWVKKETQALAEKLKAERSKRTEELKTLNAELRTQVRALEKRLSELDEVTSQSDAELRDQVLEQSRSVMAEIQQVSSTISETLQGEVQDLRAEKADTASLVQLFSDMALRLTEDLPHEPEDGE